MVYCTLSIYFPVPIAKRFHPFPFRTRQLSSFAPKILRWSRRGKIGRRWVQLFIKPLLDLRRGCCNKRSQLFNGRKYVMKIITAAKENTGTLMLLVTTFVFSIILSLCLIFKGDDFIWRFVNNAELVDSYYTNPNGRYIGNFFTYITIYFPIIRYTFLPIVTMSTVYFSSKLTDNINSCIPLFILLFFAMPSGLFAMTINWLSAFSIYGGAFLFTIIYLNCLYKRYKCTERRNIISDVVLPIVVCVCGSLFVENTTVYLLIVTLFLTCYSMIRLKNLIVFSFSSLVGAIMGSCIMFSNYNYRDIVKGDDSGSKRTIHWSVIEIYQKIYKDILPYFAKPYYLLHTLIVISFIIIYSKKIANKECSNEKYIKLSLAISIVYTVYSIFTSCFADFVALSWSQKNAAFEWSLTFIYIISIVYLTVRLLDGNRRIRVMAYLISLILITAPLCIVTPINYRCFYSVFTFWLLMAVECFIAVYQEFPAGMSKLVSSFLNFAAITLMICLSIVNITNKYYDILRADYIYTEFEKGNINLEIVKIPYTQYCVDVIATEFSDDRYEDYYFLYYGIKNRPDGYKYIMIDAIDLDK